MSSRWRVDTAVQPDATVHVWPEEDLVPHDLDSWCWCLTALEEQSNGVVLMTHHSLDGRERYE